MRKFTALKILILITFFFAFIPFLPQRDFFVEADTPTIEWVGGVDNNWETGGNWNTGVVPTTTDDVLIDVAETVNLSGTTTVNSLTLGNSSTSTAVVLNFAYDAITNGALIVDGGDVIMYEGTKIRHSAGGSAVVGTVKVDVTAGDFTVNSGASIDVNYKGHSQRNGPGSQGYGDAGGGYGSEGTSGYATSTASPTYGSYTNPVDIGSGGGGGPNGASGGAGGGAVILEVNGVLINDGSIVANGQSGSGDDHWGMGGGGSGGTVNITAGTIAGGGSISANGGRGPAANYAAKGGGGGGGRIAINYNSDSYTGSITAYGARRYTNIRSSAGTVYLNDLSSGEDTLVIDNNPSSTVTGDYYFEFEVEMEDIENIVLRNNARLLFDEAVTLNNFEISNGCYLKVDQEIFADSIEMSDTILHTYDGGSLESNTFSHTNTLYYDHGGYFEEYRKDNVVVSNGSTYVAYVPRTFNNLEIAGDLYHPNNSTAESYIIDFTMTGDFTLTSTGSIDLDGKGYSGGYGPSVGASTGDKYKGGGGGGYGGAGSRGGNGGGAGGSTYLTSADAFHLGSGGGKNSTVSAGSGGGALKIVAGGTTTIDGSISAKGGKGSTKAVGRRVGGSGSGGGVYIETGVFEGSGSINVSGGNGATYIYTGGGAGGGGRIYIGYGENNFTGSLVSNGGNGGGSGSTGSDSADDGTIVLTQTNSSPQTSYTDIVIGDDGNFYAGLDNILEATYSDPDGSDNLDELFLLLSNPEGENIEMKATVPLVNSTDQTPTILSGSDYINDVSYDIYIESEGDVVLTDQQVFISWNIETDWDWFPTESMTYAIKAIDQSAVDSGYSHTVSEYSYFNELEFDSSEELVVTDSEGEAITSGSWVASDATINWSGLKVIFSGTDLSPVYPDKDDFNVKISDENERFWTSNPDSGEAFASTTNSLETHNLGNQYTVEIVDIPTGGTTSDTRTFSLNVDTVSPSVSKFESSSHQSSSVWYSARSFTALWSVSDADSGLALKYRYLTQNSSLSSSQIKSLGTQATSTTWTSGTLTDGIWKYYMLFEDEVGNEVSRVVTFKVDATKPTIGSLNGNYNGVWQNITKQPSISWDDPESLSGNTYYITTDGTDPSSNNFKYSTNQTSYVLPTQKEGTTRIKVVSKSGSGLYSNIEEYVLKYDSTPPSAVSEFSSVIDTNEVALSWENPNSGDFNKVVVVRKKESSPESINDGVKIYEGSGNTFIDEDLEFETEYYYAIWALDNLGNVSTPLYSDVVVEQEGIEEEEEETVTFAEENNEEIKEIDGKVIVEPAKKMRVKIPVKRLIGDQDILGVDSVVLEIDGQEYEMFLDDSLKYFVSEVETPKKEGSYEIVATAKSKGEVLSIYTTTLEVQEQKPEGKDEKLPFNRRWVLYVMGSFVLITVVGIGLKVRKSPD